MDISGVVYGMTHLNSEVVSLTPVKVETQIAQIGDAESRPPHGCDD
jgi:hypothetical protein